jgi:hypothetical protein
LGEKNFFFFIFFTRVLLHGVRSVYLLFRQEAFSLLVDGMDGQRIICGHLFMCGVCIFFDDLLLYFSSMGEKENLDLFIYILNFVQQKKKQIDNIATCLRLLTALGIPLDDVTASDIHQGNLKSILTVFFALSRYKQQQKLQHQQQQQQEMAK